MVTLIRALADLLRIVASASPTPCVRARAYELYVQRARKYTCVCVPRPRRRRPPALLVRGSGGGGVLLAVCSGRAAAGEGVGVKDALRVHRGPLREGRISVPRVASALLLSVVPSLSLPSPARHPVRTPPPVRHRPCNNPPHPARSSNATASSSTTAWPQNYLGYFRWEKK